jgi:DNA-binding transcriptional MerR regulator
MAEVRSFTLSEIARRLDVPQHKLIHLCEKRVVVPEIRDAAGRGSSRVFSANNFLELAVALRLRDMMIPVNVAGAIVHVLRRFGQEVQTESTSPSLAESLRSRRAPELRVIISDGEAIYFSLARPNKKPALFGGIPLHALTRGSPDWDGKVQERGTSVVAGNHPFGGPEGSEFARMELSVTSIARALPLD